MNVLTLPPGTVTRIRDERFVELENKLVQAMDGTESPEGKQFVVDQIVRLRMREPIKLLWEPEEQKNGTASR
jgi:hypothetical protein